MYILGIIILSIYLLGGSMASVKIVKWGNSCGVRIPAKELQSAKLKVGDELKIEVSKQGGLTMMPVQQDRDGWFEAFNQLADEGGDELMFNESTTSFDEDEWQW